MISTFAPPEYAKKGAKVKKIVTPEMIKEVEQLSGIGLTQEQIFQYYGWSGTTWYKAIREYPELKKVVWTGKSKCISKVWNALYRSALEGNTAAQIFWLKINAGAYEQRVLPGPIPNEGIKQLMLKTTDPIEASKIYQQIMLGENANVGNSSSK